MQAEGIAHRPTGMRAFLIIWVGQFVSLMGTAMTNFALPIYIFQQTGRVQELALLNLAFVLPLIIMSPFAGAIVDRSNRKLMMMISDLAAGVMTIVILILFTTGRLEIWQLYITAAVSGVFQSFQWPAYSATISVMLPKEQYGRANGLLSLAESGSQIFAPVMAGALLAFVGLQGILTIDIITFVFAIGALVFVFIPQPPRTAEGAEGSGSLLKESLYGFWYIWKRPSLLGLQLVFMTGNFLTGIAYVTMPALILARTDSNELIFGTIQSVAGVGGVLGALLMSAWGGPKRRVHGVLIGWLLTGLLGMTLMGLAQGIVLWVVSAFIGFFLIPIMNGSNQAIWQAKVAPDLQGRVFSVRRVIAWVTTPLASLIAIPLADKILGPAMEEGGAMVPLLEPLVGSGAGAGISVIWVATGLLTAVVAVVAYLFPVIRNAEDLLPDHEVARGEPAKPENSAGAEAELTHAVM